MGRLLLLALRNVRRNQRRSLLTAGAVFFGTAAVIFLQGFANGFLEDGMRSVIESQVGGVQIHRAGFLSAETNPLALDLALDDGLVEKVRAVPGVLAVTARIVFDGMVSNGSQTTMAVVVAVDPVQELTVCPGRWTGAGSSGLSGKLASGAVVGRTLGEALGAGKGGSLSLLSGTRAGASNALDLTVEDLAGTTNPLESKRKVVVGLAFAQELLGMQGRATELAIRVKGPRDTFPVAEALRTALGPAYEVSTWQDLLPGVRDMLERVRIILNLVCGVLFLLVLSGIVNTMLMAVYERVREIGTMLAVGVRRAQVVFLFLAESFALGLMGGTLGATAGALLVGWLGARGVDLTPPGTDVPISIHPWISPGFLALTLAVAAVGALLAAVYPAWRASRLTPVEALRAI